MSKKKIRVNYVFQSYPVFYQPYIPPVVNSLFRHNGIELRVKVFKGPVGHNVVKLPSYNFRRIYETLYQLMKRHPKKLNFLEIKSLKENVDIIHIQDSFLHQKIFGLLSLPIQERPKIIITLRGSDTYVKPWLQQRWFEFYKGQAMHVDAFIVMSNHQKNYLCRKWGISKNKIHVIPISLHSTKNLPPKQRNKKTIRISSAYRMCWEKNIEGNLRVVRILKEKGFKVKYDLYGDGPDVGQVFYLIEKYEIQEEVVYHGKVKHDKLIEALQKSDFYLQLSHSESLGMSVIEAQSLGLPVIVSTADGLPEAIQNGVTGYAVRPEDSEQASQHIIDLWGNESMYEMFSKQSIKFVNTNFTMQKEIDSLVGVYKNLLS